MSHVRRNSMSGSDSGRGPAKSRIPRPIEARQPISPVVPDAAASAKEEGLKKILEGMRLLEISSVEELQLVVSESQRESPPLSPPQLAPRDHEEFRICIYDLETTGLGKTEGIGIVEVGALVAGYTHAWGWREIATFHSLCVPKTKVEKGVPHGHTVENLKKNGKKPFEADAKKKFEKFLKDQKVTILVAHNGKRYDHRIMAFHEFEPGVNIRAADSITWFKMALPAQPSYNLRHLHTIRTGSPVAAAHNALPDCYGVLDVMKTLKCLNYDACLRMSEPWEAVKSRCFGKK